MASLFGFGPSAKVEIELAGKADGEKRETIKVDGGADNTKMELPIFTHGESIEGTVRVVLPPGKKMDHIGIRLEIIGIIDLFYDRSNSQEFTSRCDELETQGQLDKTKEYSFKFDNVNMQYESYNGTNVQLRYYLRATVQK